MKIIGVDPGIKGAFCVLEVLGNPNSIGKREVKLLFVSDFPLYKEIKNKLKETTRNRIDLKSLALLLEMNSQGVNLVLIEDVGKRATGADPLSHFAFGYATGAVHGIFSLIGIPIEKIKPEVWKAEFGLSSDKNKSIELAKRLVPESKEFLTLKSHDGRAEAILLAYLAAQKLRFK